MTVFDLGNLLTPLIEAVMFFLLFEAFLKRRGGVPLWAYGLGIAALTGIIAVSNHFLLYSFANAVGITVSAFIVSGLYQGQWWQRVLTAVFCSLIVDRWCDRDGRAVYDHVCVFNRSKRSDPDPGILFSGDADLKDPGSGDLQCDPHPPSCQTFSGRRCLLADVRAAFCQFAGRRIFDLQADP